MRWHVSNAAYGEHWTAGDVIGCCIDLDAGSMRFLRNGKDLVRRQAPWHTHAAGWAATRTFTVLAAETARPPHTPACVPARSTLCAARHRLPQ